VELFAYSTVVVLAYLLGSIPSGYLAGRAKGVDIRQVGSGNIGATNVLRTLGKPIGITVLIADALKGFLAAKFVPTLAAWLLPQAFQSEALTTGAAVAAGIAVVLGHNYTCWLRFKGGKGIATSGGMVLALAPVAALTAIAAWGLAFLLTRYVSVASIVAALVLPFAVWFWGGTPLLVGVISGLSALAIYKHRPNIRRLLEGTEHRFKPGTKEPAT